MANERARVRRRLLRRSSADSCCGSRSASSTGTASRSPTTNGSTSRWPAASRPAAASCTTSRIETRHRAAVRPRARLSAVPGRARRRQARPPPTRRRGSRSRSRSSGGRRLAHRAARPSGRGRPGAASPPPGIAAVHPAAGHDAGLRAERDALFHSGARVRAGVCSDGLAAPAGGSASPGPRRRRRRPLSAAGALIRPAHAPVPAARGLLARCAAALCARARALRAPRSLVILPWTIRNVRASTTGSCSSRRREA